MPHSKLLTLLALSSFVIALDAAASQSVPPADIYGDPLPAGAKARLGTLRWRHSNIVGFVAFAPDGKSVISADGDQVIHVWDFPSGKELHHFGPGVDADSMTRASRAPFGFGSRGLPVAQSRDGKTAACNFDRAEILLFEVASGKQVGKLNQRGNTSKLQFSPDGKYLAVRDGEGELIVWNWASAKAAYVAPLGQCDGCELAYSPDGKLLATLAEDVNVNVVTTAIKLLDAATGATIRSIHLGSEFYLGSLQFSPDGKTLTAADEKGFIHLLDVETAKEHHKIDCRHSHASPLIFSKDGKALFTRDVGKLTVHQWDVATGEPLRHFGSGRLLEASSGVLSLLPPALSPDGKTLAIAGSHHVLQFVDIPSGKEVHGFGSITAPFNAIGFAPAGAGQDEGKGQRPWTFSNSAFLRYWAPATGKELETIKVPGSQMLSAISPDCKFIATEPLGKKDGAICDVATGKSIGTIKAGAGGPRLAGRGLVFSPESTLMALRREREQKIEVFEVPSGKLRHGLAIVGASTDRGMPRSLAFASTLFFSCDARQIAGCSEPGMLSVWATDTGKKHANLPFGTSPPSAGAFLPDGRSLALDMSDGTVVLWELASNKARRVFGGKIDDEVSKLGRVAQQNLAGDCAAVATVAISPRGNLPAHAGLDRAVHVWDIHTAKEVACFHGHLGTIHAIVFSADGQTLASTSSDATALLWDLAAIQALPPPRRVLTAEELETRWARLRGDDAIAAFTSQCDLILSPAETVAFLKDRLTLDPPLNMKLVNQLIANLNDPTYKVRQKADADLLKLGERVLPVIEKALTGNLALEPKKRLEDLRERFSQTVVLREDALRNHRAIETLERIGTPDAREILRILADGTPGALKTIAAQASLKRLKR